MHRNASVPEGMSRERHQRDIVQRRRERPYAFEVVPTVATGCVVDLPAVLRRLLLRTKALSIEPSSLPNRLIPPDTKHMHRRVREVIQSACVIEV